MTLKNRNRIFLIASLLMSILAFSYAALIVYAALTGAITPPDNPVRFMPFESDFFLLRYEFWASIASVFVLILYVPFISLIVSRGFGNTQSLELIYFGGFLLACMAEGFRLFMPLFGLWQSYSMMLVIAGRAVITGRLLSFISLLFAALFNETDQRQYVERNFMVMLIIALLAGVLMPLDTTQTSSACTVLWGYRPLFFTMRVCLFVLTELTFIIAIVWKGNREHIKTAIAYPLLMAGYTLLCYADNYLFAGAGTLLFVIGTGMYLTTLHSIYMWK